MFVDNDPIHLAEVGLRRAQRQVDAARAEQIMWLQSAILRQAAYRDGYRSVVTWAASRLDEHHQVAKDLVFLAERVTDEVIWEMQVGQRSYTRVLAEERLREAGGSPAAIEASKDLDLADIRKLTTRYKKMSRQDERRIFDSQYVSFQPSLDGSTYRLHGQLGAFEGELCRQAIERRADAIASSQDPHLEPGLRRALALTTMCQDDLAGQLTGDTSTFDPNTPPRERRAPIVTVVADRRLAEASGNEQGVEILAGPRVGPDTVDLVECVGQSEEIEVDGQQVAHSAPPTRVVKRRLRRAVLARDGRCPGVICGPPRRKFPHSPTTPRT